MMILLAAAAATYALRVTLITVVPASRLPAQVRGLLGHLAPAAFAALVATALVGAGGMHALVSPRPEYFALLAAGLVAWRVRNLALPVVVAIAVMVVCEVLP